MFHLMKLELKKFKLQSYVIGAIIASMSILGFIIFISFIEKSEGVFLFINYPESFLVIDTFVRGTFIIFAATLIAELIISEFKDKTITVLFMYPISRKKLMAAKLLVIMLFTFFAIVFVNVFVSSVFYLISSNMDLVQDTLTIAVVQTIASKMVHECARRGVYEFDPAILWNEKIFRSNDDCFFHLYCRIGLFKF